MLTTKLSAAIGTIVALAALVGFADERAAPRITVFAASSLTDVFPTIDRQPRFSFASSSTLAEQIRQGAPADIFASADTKNPQLLYREGLCGKPTVFATNALVVVYPKSNPGDLNTVFDMRRPGLKVVIARQGVPVGDYTRAVLRNLGILRAVLANVVSEEADARSVLAKVALGEADAGFVYRTDAASLKKRIGAAVIPRRAQPPIRYGICVVTSSDERTAARAFVESVLGKTGRTRLTAAGFGVPAAKK
jgi:molybdate transport system substrate-binding protein